jgi:hypothetical protein
VGISSFPALGSRFPGVTSEAQATFVSVPEPSAPGIRRDEGEKVFIKKDLSPITDKNFGIMVDGVAASGNWYGTGAWSRQECPDGS